MRCFSKVVLRKELVRQAQQVDFIHIKGKKINISRASVNQLKAERKVHPDASQGKRQPL